MEEIAFGEMGMMEQEFDNCTPRYFVARLNGLRSAQQAQKTFFMQMFREVCFYAGNGGNFKKGVKRKEIFRLPHESEMEKERSEQLIKELDAMDWLRQWKQPQFGKIKKLD